MNNVVGLIKKKKEEREWESGRGGRGTRMHEYDPTLLVYSYLYTLSLRSYCHVSSITPFSPASLPHAFLLFSSLPFSSALCFSVSKVPHQNLTQQHHFFFFFVFPAFKNASLINKPYNRFLFSWKRGTVSASVQ